MTSVTSSPESTARYRDQLIDAGLLLSTGVDGVYGRSDTFERVASGIERVVAATGSDESPRVVRFPPVVPRQLLERTDYLRSFPTLAGSISSFDGDEAAYARMIDEIDAGRDWGSALSVTELALCPAACHPLYAALVGPLPPGGSRFDVYGYVFRREPSADPARLQAFRQYEFVYVGEPEGAAAHRDRWLQRAAQLLERLGLEFRSEPANDPFFGRAGRLLADGQREAGLKTELLVETGPKGVHTAVSSVNGHGDHFGRAFDLRCSDGSIAHSACVGFGVERIALALLCRFGPHPALWHHELRALLGL